ncbi:MAG: prepilin-type N-terminal cleavage/methylation domain-containing protein [Clostridiales bacterium]|nr:prepilin-type N-terminal cleavage/methylation domain-containing protein [Clostridiales bacterium]
MIRKTKKKGLTLIEMVAAIAIIGILAATLIPEVSSYAQRAEDTKLRTEAKVLLNAIEMYNASVNDSTKRIGNDTVFSSCFNATSKKLTADFDASVGEELEKMYEKLSSKNSPLINKTVSEIKTIIETGQID